MLRASELTFMFRASKVTLMFSENELMCRMSEPPMVPALSPACGGELERGRRLRMRAPTCPSLALPRKRGREWSERGDRA
jgi:hypothetical protein